MNFPLFSNVTNVTYFLSVAKLTISRSFSFYVRDFEVSTEIRSIEAVCWYVNVIKANDEKFKVDKKSWH